MSDYDLLSYMCDLLVYCSGRIFATHTLYKNCLGWPLGQSLDGLTAFIAVDKFVVGDTMSADEDWPQEPWELRIGTFVLACMDS